MSNDTVNKLLVDGFSSYMLIDLEQNQNLPPLDDSTFIYHLEKGTFDLRLSLVSQLSKLISVTKGKYFIPIKLANYCLFADLLFESIKENDYIDSKLLDICLVSKLAILKLLMKDPRFLQTSKHYLRQFFDRLLNYGMGWSQNLGGSGADLLDAWKKTINELQKLEGAELDLPDPLQKKLDNLDEVIQDLLQKEAMVAESEKKHLDSREPKRRVDEFLDNNLKDKKFPSKIANFLTIEWRNTLLHHAERDEIDSKEWAHLSDFTTDLVTNFDLSGDGANILIISTMRPKLEKFLIASASDKNRILQDIDKINDNILNDVNMDGISVRPFLEKNRLKHLNFSSSIIKTVSNLKPGQWIYFTEGELANHRLKISSKLEGSQEFMFVNQTCSRIFIKSYQGLAYVLMAKKAKLLDAKNTFNKSFVQALDIYFKRFKDSHHTHLEESKKQEEEIKKQNSLDKIKREADRLRAQKDEMEQQLKDEAERLRQTNQELEHKIKRELDEKHAKETELIRKEKEKEKEELERKYLAEVESLKQRKDEAESLGKQELEDLKIEKERLQKKLEIKSEENRRYETEQEVKALSIGSWMSLPNQSGKNVTCKIAIIYASSGKYVFVDNTGMRIAEYVADEIVDLLIAGSAEILKQESSFESSMEKIIKSLKD